MKNTERFSFPAASRHQTDTWSYTDVIITLWRNNDVIITPCVHWEMVRQSSLPIPSLDRPGTQIPFNVYTYNSNSTLCCFLPRHHKIHRPSVFLLVFFMHYMKVDFISTNSHSYKEVLITSTSTLLTNVCIRQPSYILTTNFAVREIQTAVDRKHPTKITKISLLGKTSLTSSVYI